VETAAGPFLTRRKRQGRPLLKISLTGDTDEGPDRAANLAVVLLSLHREPIRHS
jgi:hypothetical protein